MQAWAECVPNVSQGRDSALLDRLRDRVRAAGAEFLDLHADQDHNRSVLTFAGPLDRLQQAVLAVAESAVDAIDLRRHEGVHPRVGALDVVPVVPLGGTGTEDCVESALGIAERLWEELELPVYLYGAAARTEGRARLESFRKQGFERLSVLASERSFAPDVGGPALHPTAGACCVGVREPMAAFNVLIEGPDAAAAAQRIARAVRESSGGLPGVKALGLWLDSAGAAQVSMNVTALRETRLDTVFEAVCAEAERLGASVLESELVGLVPRAALGPDPSRLRIRGFSPSMLLEERLPGLG